MVLKMAEIGSIAEENIDDNRNEEAEQLEMGQLGRTGGLILHHVRVMF